KSNYGRHGRNEGNHKNVQLIFARHLCPWVFLYKRPIEQVGRPGENQTGAHYRKNNAAYLPPSSKPRSCVLKALSAQVASTSLCKTMHADPGFNFGCTSVASLSARLKL